MTDYSNGAAYFDGAYMPLAEARVPVTHFAYRRSDVTYDVVGVHDGNFFRLEDHITRFRESMTALRMSPPESDDDIRNILHRIVALAGLRSAYVAMDCLRASPPPDRPRSSAHARAYLSCYAVPEISIATPQNYERGLHMIVARTLRIAPESFDPRVKNFMWGDFTQAQFEAVDVGADAAVLLDAHGNVTEGAGFNVFCIRNDTLVTPRTGALEGITRRSVIELCNELNLPVEIRDIHVNEFCDADEILTCTTAGGIVPVSRIDGRIMCNDRPGPISTQLAKLFQQKRAQGWHATPVDYSTAQQANGDKDYVA